MLISKETDELLYNLHQKISDTRPSEKEMAQHACFIAGTLVHTDKGLVPINKIKVDDRVLSRDENNPDAENVYKRLVSTFKSVEKKRIIHQKYLTQEGYGYLFCTEDHPIWVDHLVDAVEDKNGKLIPERTHDGWTPAIYLSSYDKHALRTVDNGLAFIASFETTSKATSILGTNCIGFMPEKTAIKSKSEITQISRAASSPPARVPKTKEKTFFRRPPSPIATFKTTAATKAKASASGQVLQSAVNQWDKTVLPTPARESA